MNKPFTYIIKTDLRQGVEVKHIPTMLFTNDENAHKIGVELYENRERVNLDQESVMAYLKLSDGTTTEIVGSISDNTAWVLLTYAAYLVEGPVEIIIRLIDTNYKNVIGDIRTNIKLDKTGTVVTPELPVADVEELVEYLRDMASAASAANSAASNALSNFAGAFAAATAYDPGTYVTYTDGKLYYLPNGHAANATWANTDKRLAPVGGELESLRTTELSNIDTELNLLGSYINYNYDTPYYWEENLSQSTPGWQYKTGIVRCGNVVTLHKSTLSSNTIRIKVSGPIGQAANTTGIKAWTEGIQLKKSHRYRIVVRLIGGSSKYDDNNLNQVPYCILFKAGASSDLGTLMPRKSDGIAITEYTPGGNNQYNIAILLDASKYIFDHAKLLITLQDITSGTIKETIDYSLYINKNFSNDFIGGKYFALSEDVGSAVSVLGIDANYCRIKIPCKAGDKFVLTSATEEDGPAVWAFTNSNNIILSKGTAGESVTGLELIADLDGYFLANALINSTHSLTGKLFKPVAEDVEVLKNAVGKDDIPDYYFEDDYLPDRIDAILENRKTLSVAGCTKLYESIFFTDPHYFRDDVNTTDNGLQSVKLIDYIMNHTNIGHIVCGGDMTNGNTMTNAQCRALFSAIRDLMAPIWDHTWMCLGNHEWNNPGNSSSQTQNETTFLQIFSQFVADKLKYIGGYEKDLGCYYVDDSLNKIRTFYLGCTKSGVMTYNVFKWFFNAVTSTPTGYTFIVYSHIGLNKENGSVIWIDDSFEPFVNLLSAAKNKIGFSYNWPGTSWTGSHDFSSDGYEVVGIISGHKHQDISKYSDESMLYGFSNNSYPEWISNASYSVGEMVKKTAVDGDTITTTAYKCTTANSDAAFNTSNWTKKGAIGITKAFPEWVGGTSYSVGAKVKVTSGGTVSYYRCITANNDGIFNSEKWENYFRAFPVICTTCDRGPTSTNSSAIWAARPFNTIDEQAIDVVQIDMTNKTIDLTRIGGSYDGSAPLENPDRHFTY